MSELQPCLANWFFIMGYRNTGNSVSECSILKISWGNMSADPTRRLTPLVLVRCLAAPTKFWVQCFQIYMSATLKKCQKPGFLPHVDKCWANISVLRRNRGTSSKENNFIVFMIAKELLRFPFHWPCQRLHFCPNCL